MKSRIKNKRTKRKLSNKIIPSYGLGSWIKGATKDVGEFTGAKKVADWAGEQVGSDIRGAVKDVTGFAADVTGDFYTGVADVGLGVLGAGDVIGKDAYETGVGREAGEIASKYVAPIGGQIAANIVAPGVGGAVLGGVQQGVGSGMQQGQQQQAQQQAMQQQQQIMNKQNFTQQRLQSYNQGQGNQYVPTFKMGGILNSYQRGGVIPDSTLQAGTRARSMYQATKQPADSAMQANYPELQQIKANAPTNLKQRMQYADSVAKANPNISLDNPSNYLTDEQVSNLKMSRQQMLEATNTDVSGTGNNPDAYGIRNYLMTPSARKQQITDGEITDDYEVMYDINTGQFYRNDQNYKRGGKMYAKGGKVYHAVKADETKGDDPKYPINSAKDVKDAWKLRNHAKGLDISQEALNNRIKRQASKYDVDLNTDNKAMGGKLNSYAGGGNVQELTRYNDDITSYQSGGSTHEESPYGGIPIGRKGTVEHGEFRYGDYIFSNRF